MKVALNRSCQEGLLRSAEDLLTHPELGWIVTSRIVQYEGFFLFDRFVPAGKMPALSKEVLQDETGMECFANHFHFPVSDIGQGLTIAVSLFAVVDDLWRRSVGPEVRLRQIVSYEEIDEAPVKQVEATYRFHALRSGQVWLNEDLNNYSECVLVCDS